MQPGLTCIMLINDRLSNFINKIVIDKAHVADRVLRMHSAEDALSYLSGDAETLHSIHIPDLIILDMEMPGFDVGPFLDKYKDLKMGFPLKPVIILLTAFTDLEHVLNTFHSTELSGIYQKPLTHEILTSIVSEYLERATIKTFV